MKKFNGVSITARARRRKLKSGAVVAPDQWFANYNDPKTGQRKVIAFNRKKDAEAYKTSLLLKVAEGSYVDERRAPTVAQALDHWLATKEGNVKSSTLKGYKVVANGAIRGPLLIGTKQERADYTETGIAPKGARFIKLLGDIKLPDLNTAMIRQWHRTVTEQCGAYTANRAKSHLKSLSCHPDTHQKLGRSISHFTVGSNRFGTRCFFIIYGDGSKDDFSFKDCIRQVTPAQ